MKSITEKVSRGQKFWEKDLKKTFESDDEKFVQV